MRESSFRVMSKTPQMTKATPSKMVTASNRAINTNSTALVNPSATSFADAQTAVNFPQSKLLKMNTIYRYTMNQFLPHTMMRLTNVFRSKKNTTTTTKKKSSI